MDLFEKSDTRTWIKDLKAGDKINSPLKVMDVQRRKKKTGAPFLSLELVDKTGKIQGKVWDNAEQALEIIRPGGVYRFSGLVNTYQGRIEIKVESLSPLPDDEKAGMEEDFTPPPPFDLNKRYSDMLSLLRDHIAQPQLRRLVDLFDERFGEDFKKHFGAQKIHHAFAGGLLEHTDAIIRLAIPLAQQYDLNKEVLIIGALFHDIGKLQEYGLDPVPATTPAGGLIGHIIIGNQIFLEMAGRIDGFPEDLSLQIQHLIISHHGEKEFGAPEIPKTAEALALHVIDLFDSKLKIMREAIANSGSSAEFSEYIHALGRRVFIPEDDREGSAGGGDS